MKAKKKSGAKITVKENKNHLFWVGIGASAGGLEALRNFVTYLPKQSNMTYIIVQHLSPNHKSMLAELINRETHLNVKEIEDGEKPKADTIYITPSAHEVFIKEGRLFLKLSGSDIGPKPSVNNFFYSLANEIKEYAIGIILSGTGSDGSNGIRAIRAAGGITMAQDEDSAKYFTMPGSAVETGCIDLVLNPENMAKKLQSLIDIPRNKIPIEEREVDTDKFETLCKSLKRYSGVDFREYKYSTLHRRIERRMTARSIFDFSKYVDFVLDNQDELETLFKDILISVTSFFRDKDCFQALAKEVKSIVESKGNQTIRVWVPGCATGEEVYSIAILFAEEMGMKIFTNARIIIFARH